MVPGAGAPAPAAVPVAGAPALAAAWLAHFFAAGLFFAAEFFFGAGLFFGVDFFFGADSFVSRGLYASVNVSYTSSSIVKLWPKSQPSLFCATAAAAACVGKQYR